MRSLVCARADAAGDGQTCAPPTCSARRGRGRERCGGRERARDRRRVHHGRRSDHRLWRLSTRVEVWALCRDRRPPLQLGRTACRSPIDARSHRRDGDRRSAPPIHRWRIVLVRAAPAQGRYAGQPGQPPRYDAVPSRAAGYRLRLAREPSVRLAGAAIHPQRDSSAHRALRVQHSTRHRAAARAPATGTK